MELGEAPYMKNNYKNIKIQIEKYKVFIQSIFLNILCVLFFKLICEVHFDTNTDQFLNHILSGVHGENASAYGWIHIITGYSLKKLYSFIPQVPWYALIQYVCIFISLLLLTNIIFKTNSKWGGYAANILILIIIGYECYARISYVKTSVLCLAIGCFIFYQICCKRISKKIYLLWGVLLFLVGYLWWNKSFFLGMLILIPCVYRLFRGKNLSSFKEWKRYILICLIIFLCPVFLEIGNKFYLKSNSEIEKNVKYTKTLEYINNYGWPDFFENYSQYDELGISENTFYLLSSNEFVDRYIVEPETLIKIKDFVSKPTLLDFLNFTRIYPIRYFETGLFVGFLIFLILLFLSKADNKTKKMAYIFCGTGLFYYICYLIGVDDIEVIRTSIWMTAIISILGFAHDITIKEQELKPYYSAVITIAMVIVINQKLSAITCVIDENYITLTTEWMELVTSDSSKTYVTDNTDYYQKDMPFESFVKASQDNILVSKFSHTLYNSRELSNVLENPDEVYFLSESSAVFTAIYINEHYGTDYYPVQVKYINNIAFYVIRNGGLNIDEKSIKMADSDIISDLHLYTVESGNKAIEGSIYKKASNSFRQMCYIEVYNPDEDSYTFYDVSQTQGLFSSDVMNGKYSAFYTEIEPAENGENDEYAVILEMDGDMFRVPLFEEDVEG